MNRKKFRTGILDDHLLFMEGIAGILERYPWMDIVFTGQSGKQLFSWLEAHSLDLLLLDISLGEENGLELLDRIRKDHPSIRVIVLTTHQPADIELSLEDFAGDAYVLKISGRTILEEAFEAIKAGKRYFDPNLISLPKMEKENPHQLTRREMEIVSLITQGKSNRDIAKELFISEMTLQTHRRNIGLKLGAKGTADLFYKLHQLKK